MTENNFIKNIIEENIKTNKGLQIITRFPPEPNGYLHVGHAKSICLNFSLAQEFGGRCNLRFDDTNPEHEDIEYVQSIKDDIKWLGFSWDDEVKYASDYFEKLYEFAVYFIEQGLAYVCDLSSEQMRKYRGDFNQVGQNSPYRNRQIAENLGLFNKMRNGEFVDGAKTLRLKIDMTSANINLRDPVIYRIKRVNHIRTSNSWCVYPMYDYTHCISDALEDITHSCCTLEFKNHRPLYNWIIEHLIAGKMLNCYPQQIEFSRLELQYTVTSKRKLNQLVIEKIVNGWDDPRMPTISGMRRRGYRPSGIKLFAKRCGISKSPNIVDLSLLENSIREDLEENVPRIMAVVRPLKVVLTNFNEDTGSREAYFHPHSPIFGKRIVALTKEIYIEQEDFMLEPIDNWQRLTVGKEIRLRNSYIIKCDEVIQDKLSNIIELHCSIDHNTLGKNPEGRKVKGVIHWVSIENAILAEVRIYDRLFNKENLDQNFKQFVNKDSLEITTAFIEPVIESTKPEDIFQFERIGYFVADRYDYTQLKPIFNKIVSLKDNWKKE